MSRNKRQPTHPGEILLEEFLKPMGIPQDAFMEEVVNGKRRITMETAIVLAKTLNTSPHFWINLQADYDVWVGIR